MPLTQRQIECFKNNGQFLTETAAALQVIAAEMLAEALVAENSETTTPVQRTFAGIRGRIAQQVLAEQGVTNIVQSSGLPSAAAAGNATSGSVAMKYLVQQMLMSEAWTMTPDEWATNELTARSTIATVMRGLLTALTAIPTQEPA